MVPLGIRAKRLQPHHSIGQDVVARLLGAHRIRLRPVFNSAKRPVQRVESNRRPSHHFRSNGFAFFAENFVEKADR
jgi:hypothetical protein